jgi:uncharacterized protein
MSKLRVIFLAFILLSTGCSSLPLQQARTEFYSGNFARADQILDECKGITEKDRLICYMEKGIILYYSDEYEESTQALLEASRFMKSQDQISITEQSSALLINDRVNTYKGEYCERLWVHTFLMMDFLMQYKYEEALVEAKQALEVYDEYPGSLAGDHFTRALIALCFEDMNLPDDARIEYEKIGAAMDSHEFEPGPIASGKGELILFIGQDRIPYKVATEIVIPPSTRLSIPRYTDAPHPGPVEILLDGAPLDPLKISTDLGQVAQSSLKDRSAQYLTRQVLRAGAKEAISREAGERNQLGEVLVRTILFLLEEADTRSWETLPGGLTLVRVTLDAGIHDLEISSEGSKPIYLDGVNIPEGQRVYRSLRF